MPGWPFGRRIEEIRPTFDVFTLVKTLWSMVSGKPLLPLWYFADDEFTLERQFPDHPDMTLVNRLLAKTIVEREKDCLENAGALLTEIDHTLTAMTMASGPSGDGLGGTCRICGRGSYRVLTDGDSTGMHNLGLAPTGDGQYRVLACPRCGNVQLFFQGGKFVSELRKSAG